jgi:O-antigen/teichoic acid export membrane protein
LVVVVVVVMVVVVMVVVMVVVVVTVVASIFVWWKKHPVKRQFPRQRQRLRVSIPLPRMPKSSIQPMRLYSRQQKHVLASLKHTDRVVQASDR